MGMFSKHCYKCGVDVDKNTAPKRFGNYFCSDEHAEEYVAEVEAMKKKAPEQKSGGGCC